MPGLLIVWSDSHREGVRRHALPTGPDFSSAQAPGVRLNCVGHCDTKGAGSAAEFLLQRLLDAGLGGLSNQSGAFAAVIEFPEGLVAVCDRAGNRPLYLHRNGQSVVIGTCLAAVARQSGSYAIDRRWEDFLLSYEFIPGQDTIYQGVSSLTPGLPMVEGELPFSISNSGVAQSADAADEILSGSLEVDSALEQAFESTFKGLPERVAVLMGGFDSALLASLLVRRGHDVSTYTFRYQEPGFTQPLAAEVADQLGIAHHWVDLTPDVLLRGLTDYARHFGQPAGQAHYLVFTAHACQQVAADGITHCLTGDGCDGLFLGYPTVARRVHLLQLLARLPSVLRRTVYAACANSPTERMLGHPVRVLRNIMSLLERDEIVRGYLAARTFDPVSLRNLRRQAPADVMDVESVLAQLAQHTRSMTPLKRAYSAKSSVGLNRSKLAGAAAASGLSIRAPFMHEAMASVAAKVPEHLMRDQSSLRLGLGKTVLLDFCNRRGLLQPDVIYQEKRSPVHAPVDLWYRRELRSSVQEFFLDLPFECKPGAGAALFGFPLAHRLYRRYATIDKFTSQQLGLLASYARFGRGLD